MSKIRKPFYQTLAVFSLCLALSAMIWNPASKAQIKKDPGNREIDPKTDLVIEADNSELSTIDAQELGYLDGKVIDPPSPTGLNPASDLGEESEPNDTTATADPLTGGRGRIKGYSVPGTPDIDYYSFTANAGDRVYAATMTSFSPGSVNSVLEIRDAADAILETDLDDGTFGTTSASIAGFLIPSTGTYYLRVRENGTATIRPYYLYFSVLGVAPTAEAEPNGTVGTATPLSSSGRMSGSANPVADTDFYSVSLNAGDTVFLSLDLDPERDNVQWNGRLGFGLFGTGNTQLLVTGDASVGSAANPLSEAHFMTVKDAGTYFAYVDEQVAAAGGPTATYTLSVVVIPAGSSAGCTTFTNSSPTPIADLALSSSTISVSGLTGRIRDINVFIDASHTFMQDVDWHLKSPNGVNDNGIISDVGGGTVGGTQTTMNWWIDDEAAIPPLFALSATMRHMPELAYRLDWFDGEDPNGTWTLDMRDDVTGDVGTLNSWSLQICEEPPTTSTSVLFSENFEAGAGGFTHTGTLDEWERGTPNSPATSVSPAQAAFLNCAGGSNCWKTDLDGGYDSSSSMDLVSPPIAIPGGSTNVRASWAMRYQMESATFDHAFVEAREVGNPTNSKILWQWYGATMSEGVGNPTVQIGESAGWGIYYGDITSFAGTNVELRFHVDSDSSVNYQGMAVDDVTVTRQSAPAVPVGITGQLTSSGRGIPGALVTLTEQNGTTHYAISNSFGYFKFFNILTQQTITVEPTSKRYIFTPVTFQLTGTTLINFGGTPNP